MLSNPAASWYHSNRYDSKPPCEHCGGVIRHERWCRTLNPVVQYAYGAVEEPGKLSLIDRLILHALGVAWSGCPCDEAKADLSARS